MTKSAKKETRLSVDVWLGKRKQDKMFADTVLKEVWDNEKDAAYDKLQTSMKDK